MNAFTRIMDMFLASALMLLAPSLLVWTMNFNLDVSEALGIAVVCLLVMVFAFRLMIKCAIFYLPSVQGPPGPTGAQGMMGPRGPQGERGPAGCACGDHPGLKGEPDLKGDR